MLKIKGTKPLPLEQEVFEPTNGLSSEDIERIIDELTRYEIREVMRKALKKDKKNANRT